MTTFRTMDASDLGENATEAALRWFQLACLSRQGQTGESDQAVTEWMWGQGDWPTRTRLYAAPELASGQWLGDEQRS